MLTWIDDERRNLILWGEEKITHKGRTYTTSNCPLDTKEYLHPIFGTQVRYIQSQQPHTRFKRVPAEFSSMGEYRQAWKEHRESRPIIARVMDEFLYGYGWTFVFKDNPKAELEEWLKDMRRYTLEAAKDLIDLRSNMKPDDALSFRKFSGAVKYAGLSYPASVVAIYDNLWPYRIGDQKPRPQLTPRELQLVKAVEGDFAETIFQKAITDSDYARMLIRKIAAKMSRAFQGAMNA